MFMIHETDDLDPEEIGHCDVCDHPFNVASRSDHCAECGNCFEHCTDPQEHEATLAAELAEMLGEMSDETPAEEGDK